MPQARNSHDLHVFINFLFCVSISDNTDTLQDTRTTILCFERKSDFCKADMLLYILWNFGTFDSL